MSAIFVIASITYLTSLSDYIISYSALYVKLFGEIISKIFKEFLEVPVSSVVAYKL